MTTAVIGPAISMNRERISTTVKTVVIALGAVCLGYGLLMLPAPAVSLGFLLILVFGAFVTPRMTLTLPRSKFAISFSDSLIFVTFLLYGGEGAIILAAVETFANCIYLKRNGFSWGRLMIPANVSLSVVATSATYILLKVI